MYRRPKFLEVLLSIREEMAREADYDIDLFVHMVQMGRRAGTEPIAISTEKNKAPKSKPRKLKG